MPARANPKAIGWLLLLGGLGASAGMTWEKLSNEQLLREGRETPGEVIRQLRTYGGSTSTRSSRYDYGLEIAYSVEGQARTTISSSARAQYWVEHPVGSRVTMLYLPTRPVMTEIKERVVPGSWFWPAAGIGASALGAIVLARARRKPT